MAKQLRTCAQGHQFYKSSDCPTCPVCEAEKKNGFFVKLSAPATRALKSIGVNSVQELSTFTEPEILALHGMGKASLPAMRAVLKEHNLSFKKSIV